MGSCASSNQKINQTLKNEIIHIENKEKIPELPIEQKTDNTIPKITHQIDTLKVKIPKKRARHGTENHTPELNYLIEQDNSPIEFKIKIRRSEQLKIISWPSMDEILEAINEQNEMTDIFGIKIQSISIDYNKTLESLLSNQHKKDENQTRQSFSRSTLGRENSLES